MFAEPRPGFLEFFAGAGLARLGLEPNWRCLWANDICPEKAAVYMTNFGSGELKVGDIVQVEARELPEAAMAWASFPCQDLSLAGGRRGLAAPRSGTFWEFWRILAELRSMGRRPPLIVIENVVGLLSGGPFATIGEALAALGLRFGALVIDARLFVPQSRPRVFLTAVDEDWPTLDYEVEGGRPTEWFPESLLQAVNRLPADVRERWIWWRLPRPETAPEPPESLLDLDAEGWFDPAKTERLIGLMTPTHRRRLEAIRRGSRPRAGFLFRRMRGGEQRAEIRFDGLAGCLRTPAGGSSLQTLVWAGAGAVRMRLLTPRETARLMGVPDSFKLPAKAGAAYRAMGDGVVPPAVAWLSRRLLEPLIHSSEPRSTRRLFVTEKTPDTPLA